MIEQRIIDCYSKASEDELINGRLWYSESAIFINELALKYNKTTLQVAGICSALSPLKRWDENKKLTEEFLKGKRNGHFIGQINKCKLLLKETNYLRAKAILGGLKTQNFFDPLLHPDNPYSLVVDRHIIKVATGENIDRFGNKLYKQVKQAYLNVSRELNILLNVCQATTWLTFKRIENRN